MDLEPVTSGGPRPSRVAAVVVAAAAIVAGAALAGNGFPIGPWQTAGTDGRATARATASPAFPAAANPAPANDSGPNPAGPSSRAASSVPLAAVPLTAACSAGPPPAAAVIKRPAPGSVWPADGVLPIAGSGVPTDGTLIADLDASTGTRIGRVTAAGAFVADLLTFPVAGRSRATLTLRWIPPGEPDRCARALDAVTFWLDPASPVAVWLTGGPPVQLAGPPYGQIIVGLPEVQSVSTSIMPQVDGATVIGQVARGNPIPGRGTPFSVTYPDFLAAGPAMLTVRWQLTDGSSGLRRVPIEVVGPEFATP